jgi:hypothetical protein
MAVTKEDVEQAKQDEKNRKNQERMEKETYGKPVTAPSTSPVKKAKGGSVSSRADGCAMRGKTRGKMV